MRFKVLGLTVALLGTLAAGTSLAATIGPDAFGYTATDAVPFSFLDITGTGTRVLTNVDDSDAGPLSIGFNFNFYGASFSSLFVSSNGLITFGSGDAAFSNSSFATGALSPDTPAIAPMWDDWDIFSAGTDGVYTETDGAPGSRVMTIEWHNVRGYFNSPGTISFEARLSEATGAILFSYLNTQTGDDHSSGASATIGIRNSGAPGNNDFLQWSFNSPVIGSESSILFVGPRVQAVPEPTSVLLLGSGIALAAWRLRRRA